MIILCISQNATALLKKFRVIFRHLELFFCTQKCSPGLQTGGQLESSCFRFALDGKHFPESWGGFVPALVPQQGHGMDVGHGNAPDPRFWRGHRDDTLEHQSLLFCKKCWKI